MELRILSTSFLSKYSVNMSKVFLKNNISPPAYLKYYFSECAKRGAAPSKEEIDSFLPHNLSQDIREKLRINKAVEHAPGY